MSGKRNVRADIKNAFIDILTGKIAMPLSIRSIEKITGYAAGTIYYHYKNKSDILLEVTDDFWNETFQNINQLPVSYPIDKALTLLYEAIYERFKLFSTYWIHELTQLDSNDKIYGRGVESLFFKKIHERIRIILEANEKDISKDLLEHMSIVQLSDFVFLNFMDAMKQGSKGFTIFLYILQKVIQEAK